jgi:hypothetical protein
MPSGGRRVVGLVSLLGIVIFLSSVVLTNFFGGEYLLILCSAFGLFLCLTHAWYAFAFKLSQKRVRKIDYWYLGAAAFGMLLFAAGYSDQRESVLGQWNTALVSLQRTYPPNIAFDHLRQYAFLCQDDEERKLLGKDAAKACLEMFGLWHRMKHDLSPQEADQLIQDFQTAHRTVEAEIRAGVDTEAWKKSLLIAGENASNAINYWKRFEERKQAERPKTPTDTGTKIFYGLGQFFLWPLLLAFALALRITKVTADVYGWADS